MQIVLIGSGNVATVLGRSIKQAGHQIVQVYSQQLAHAQTLARELGSVAVDQLQQITQEADLYILSVSDKALPELAAQLHVKSMVVHTAGSVSIAVLKDSSPNYGILYPLQTMRKEKLVYENLPLLIDANTAENLALLQEFAQSLSPLVEKATDNDRIKLHVAAVFVSNFTNHLYRLADDFCTQEHISFEFLKPLINETAQRLNGHKPSEMQTGPAVRNDIPTINKHLDLLHNKPDLLHIYQVLTESIQSYNK